MTAVLKLGNKTPQELGLYVLRKSQRPGLPPTVDRTLTIPGRHGAWDFGADLGPRSFDLDCAFKTRHSGELQRQISSLVAHLIDGNGRPRTMPLIFTVQPDRQYLVRYSGSLPVDRIAGYGSFTLPMIAYDPFASSLVNSDEITVDSPISVDSPLSVDAKYEYTVTGPTTLQIDNYGTLNSEPIITITGSFASLTLTVGGVQTQYNATMSGTLVLDFAAKTARIGCGNVLGHTNGAFGKLPVGLSVVQVGGTGLNMTMTVRFKAKYI